MKITKRDILWSYLGVGFKIGVNVIMLPFILYFLNGDELGIWYIFTSIGAIVFLLDFGFAPTLSRNIAYAWSGARKLSSKGVEEFVNNVTEPNIVLLNKVIFVCKKIYGIISIISFLTLFIIGTIYILYITRNENITSLLESWILFIISVSFSIYYSYYNSLLKGIGAIYEYNKTAVISKLIQIIVSFLLLLLGIGILGMSISLFFSVIVNRLLARHLFISKSGLNLKSQNNSKKDSNKSEKSLIFQAIWHNSWRDGLVSISGFFSTQMNTIIISFYLPLSEAGVFSLSLQLITITASIASALYNAYQPKLQQLHLMNRLKESKEIIGLSLITYFVLFSGGISLLVIIGAPIIRIISPTIVLNLPLITTMALHYFLLQHHKLFASFISNTNNIIYYKAFIISSFLGVFLTIILLEFTSLGVWALALAPMLVEITYNNWKWPLYVLNDLKTKFLELYFIGFNYAILLIKRKIKEI
jgi:O-antigen/teichoic acid export membrane protein